MGLWDERESEDVMTDFLENEKPAQPQKSTSFVQKAKDGLRTFTQKTNNEKLTKKTIMTDIAAATQPQTIGYRHLDDLGSIRKRQQVTIDTFYLETNSFFKDRMKTDILNLVMHKIQTKLVSDVAVVLNGKKQDSIIINQSLKLSVKESDIQRVSKNMLLFDEIVVKFDIDDVNKLVTMNSVKPYLFNKINDKKVEFYSYVDTENYEFIKEVREVTSEGLKITKIGVDPKNNYVYPKTKEDKEEILEQRVVEGVFDVLVYNEKTDLQLVKTGTLQLICLYSNLWTTTNKEIVLSTAQLLADQGYISKNGLNFYRENWVALQTVKKRTDLETAPDQKYEVVQPAMRSTDIKDMRDMIKEEIALNIGLDSSLIGLETQLEVAAPVVQQSSQTVENIIYLQKQVEQVLSNLIRYITSNSKYQVKVERYMSQDIAGNMDIVTKGVTMRAMSIDKAVEQMYPGKTEEERLLETLNIKVQNVMPLTLEEKALKLKIYGEDEVVQTQDSTTTDTQSTDNTSNQDNATK